MSVTGTSRTTILNTSIGVDQAGARYLCCPMPLTFPAHAAAVLPMLKQRRLRAPTTAWVVGSCAPDLSYLLGSHGPAAHSLRGLFTFCIPVGLLALLWLEILILPALSPIAPE